MLDKLGNDKASYILEFIKGYNNELILKIEDKIMDNNDFVEYVSSYVNIKGESLDWNFPILTGILLFISGILLFVAGIFMVGLSLTLPLVNIFGTLYNICLYY